MATDALSHKQIGKLTVNLGYASSFPEVSNERGSSTRIAQHDFLMNIAFTDQLIGPFNYTFGKGVVRHDQNPMYPTNMISNAGMSDDPMLNDIHVQHILQGSAGLDYNLPFSWKKFDMKLGLLGTYDLALRKDTDEDGVDFRMKEVTLKFSQAEIYSTIEVRRQRVSLNFGTRILNARVFSNALMGNPEGAQFYNSYKMRLTVGYHFGSEDLMRGTLNFPDVDPDKM